MSDTAPGSAPAPVTATVDAPPLSAPTKVKPPRKKPPRTEEAKPRLLAPANGVSAQQQKQRDKEFATHKAHILANLQTNVCDLSPKGSVDAKCLPVMDVLNTHKDYVTTSSCSGRIALFHSIKHSEACGADDGTATPRPRMKRGENAALGWVFVKHGMLRPMEMAQVVGFLCGAPTTPEDVALDAAQLEKHAAHMASVSGSAHCHGATPGSLLAEMYDGEVEGVLVAARMSGDEVAALPVPTRGTVSLKMEPFVMHVRCRTMEAAKLLHSAAVSDSGYRNSGVVPPGKKIMCGIRGAAGLGLEVPVVLDGVNHVASQRAYVWALLGLANEKMEANEKKIRLLEKSVAARVLPA
ncbi:Methyltransferase TYW3 [Leishmania donovani]|uniref:tRNA(Phe) 7-[(3-amino-3-carboxypropyl)-4-demethylwyosine(37)-N(4)]-methyltransferase n=1 Tax=Leishmania donovani TaxID=5661 RepID=A0A6J8F8Q6_LEIDO|nr:Methyltransferase TYW3 [Leishmania donovani]VDZ42474.1 Methyltransferase_TYW3_putative/Pfam:PF02676 [Leishmania donovani]